MQQDRFFFLKIFALMLVSLFAGANLILYSFWIFGLNMVLAIGLTITLSNLYDQAWKK